jgi:hypothetical protein
MSDGIFATRSAATTIDADAERARPQGSSVAFGCSGSEATRMILGLQRTAGNASVVQMLQRRATATGSRVPNEGTSGTQEAAEPARDAVNPEVGESRKVAEARAAEAEAASGPAEVEPPIDDPNREHSASERAEKRAEGRDVSITDELVPLGGGSPPSAEAGAGSGAFVDGGRQGSVPFGAADADLDPESAHQPRAFVDLGQVGTVTWSGGGHGGGPHVNEQTGEIQEEIPPEYDTDWGGPGSNASAWVAPGTGIVNVERSYMSAEPGDQGNGWWVSERAASALAAHEDQHVAASQDVYEYHIQPMLDKVEKSAKTGKEAAYFSSRAVAILQAGIQWAKGINEFKRKDTDINEGAGTVDVHEKSFEELRRMATDENGVRLDPPVSVFGGTVGGQRFDHILAGAGEIPQEVLPLEQEQGHGHRVQQ